MTEQEKINGFNAEIAELMRKWGIERLNAPYQHNIDGLIIQGNAPIQPVWIPNWQPPVAELNGKDKDK